MQQALHPLHGLLPDLENKIIQTISSADIVSVHLVFSGTQEGAFLGAPPSHRAIRFIAFDMHRVAGDHIVESWHLEDNLSLLLVYCVAIEGAAASDRTHKRELYESPPVLLVAYLLHPIDNLAVQLFLDRDMSHRRGGRGAVPVLLAR